MSNPALDLPTTPSPELTASWYCSLLATMTEGVVVQAPDGRIAAANPAAERILGLTREEMAGRTSLDPAWRAIRPDGTPFPGCDYPMAITLRSGEPQRGVVMGWHRPDGTLTWISINTELMPPPGDERPSWVLATFTDITEARRSEAEIREHYDIYRQMFTEHTAPMVITHAETGQIVDVNPAAAELSGYPPDDLRRMNVEELNVAPRDVFAARREVIRGGERRSFVARHRRADGSERELELLSAPIRTPERTLLYTVLHDVTERMCAERSLRESQERLDFVVRGADLGTWDWHVPGGAVVFNERWARMLGYDPSEIVPHLRTWEELVHPEDKAPVEAVLADHLAGRTPIYRTEHRLRSKTGDWVWVLDTGRVLERNAAGEPIRVAGVHLDITAGKRAEREREQAIADLRAALARVKKLEGILPTCSFCKRIRGPEGQWHSIESYISHRSEARFSHTYCPSCWEEHFPGLPFE